jgi:spermidine/putrescine transport system substrate-binding protein
LKKYILVTILLLLIGCVSAPEPKQQKELNIYNWEDYLAPDTISRFQKEFSVKVNLFTFEDENFMLSDVQTNPAKYDIVIASDSLIKEMTASRLLATINHSNIPNLKNIGKDFRNLGYDPQNTHSVPYLWGTTGIAFNIKYLPGDTDSWNVLFDKKYAGKISMLNSKEEVIIAALIRDGHPLHGHSIESIDRAHLEKITPILVEQKSLLRGYEDPITIRDSMVAEELWAAQMYSGDALFAQNENENIKYIIPKEGATIWIDNLAVPRDAKNKVIAEQFINFILRPDIGAEIANYVQYATPNGAAREFVDQELLDNPSLYPSEEVLKSLAPLEVPDDLVNEYNKVWAEVQR